MSIDENLDHIDMARLQLYQQRHDNTAELNELMVWQVLEPIRPILNGYDIGTNANSNVVNSLDNISHCSFKNVSDEDLNCISVCAQSILGSMSCDEYLQVLFYAKSLEAKLPDPDCIIQITERINILKSEVTQCEKEIFR